jgi:hypothetical protein
LEQARRATLAHHVHRFAPLGARVLINETWYYLAIYGKTKVYSTFNAATHLVAAAKNI